MKTCLTPLTGGLGALLACCLLAAPAGAASPEDAVRDHFARISAADYTGAAEFFTGAFRRAFKGDVKALDTYYLRRREQLEPGYAILSTTPLKDGGKQTARVTLDFNDPDKDAPVTVTERMHYYLIREKVESGAPLREADGMAWRIDIYDALSYDSLADARRRPYLYTREAWPDDEGRELKSRQGLYRIQQALEEYKRITGAYPAKLSGEDNPHDALLKGKYLKDNYPPNGFNGRWMREVEFGERSSGDFSYYSLDADGDGQPDGYFLLLHGKLPQNYLFAQQDTIMLLGANYVVSQPVLARPFAQWWQRKLGKVVQPGPALGPDWGEDALPSAEAAEPPAPDQSDESAAASAPAPDPAPTPQPAVQPVTPPSAAPVQPPAVPVPRRRAAAPALLAVIRRVAQAAAAEPAAAPALVVHSYGTP